MGELNLSKAAAPLELIIKGGDPEKIAVWGCGTCHLAKLTREEALRCCAPWVCVTCGKDVKNYCEDCYKKEQYAREQVTYDKAKKVSLAAYEGTWLCCDHCDNYYPDVDSLLDAHEEDAEPPTWAWGTDEVVFRLSASRIVSRQLEEDEFYEDAEEDVSAAAIKELQDFLDVWAPKQNVISYMIDNSTVVEFPEAAAERMTDKDKEIVE